VPTVGRPDHGHYTTEAILGGRKCPKRARANRPRLSRCDVADPRHCDLIWLGRSSEFVSKLTPGARQILGHADIDEIAIENDAAQRAGRGERRQRVSFQRTAVAQVIENRSVKRIDAAADQSGPRLRWPIYEFDDPVLLQGDAAITRGIGDLAQRHDADYGNIVEQPFPEGVKRDVEPGIAIEQVKCLIEMVARMPQRAAGLRNVRFDRHVDTRTGSGPVSPQHTPRFDRP
jgi:hypothetical protein